MRRLTTAALALVLTFGLFMAGCDSQVTTPSSNGAQSQNPSATANTGGPGGGPPCDITVSPGESIDDAVDNQAQPGDLVCVESGTYAEQVTINKDLTLKGLNNPTIQRPTSPDESSTNPDAFTIPESGPTWEPVVFAFGGSVDSDGNVSGSGTVDVTVKGFTVDGDNKQPGDADRSVAVFYRNANGTVSDNTVNNMAIGGKETFGILAYGNSDVDILGNDINGYERGGIGANGDGGAHPAPTVKIANNEVTGSTGIDDAWGPNGIQVGFGADGKIFDNRVDNNRHGDSYSSATSAGIIVFGSDDVHVRGNEVTNSDINLTAAAGENVRFVKNETKDAIIGVYFAGANNSKLVSNSITDPDGGPVGAVGVLNTGTNNKLINNTIDGFETPIVDLGTESKVQANAQPTMP